MNKEQHMFLKLGEEATEVALEIAALKVAHMAYKVMQFGTSEMQIGDTLHNTERLHKEMDDYQAVVEVLNQRYGLMYTPNSENIALKKLKMERYLDKSIELGCVSEDSGLDRRTNDSNQTMFLRRQAD